jgi:hypothetical protein
MEADCFENILNRTSLFSSMMLPDFIMNISSLLPAQKSGRMDGSPNFPIVYPLTGDYYEKKRKGEFIMKRLASVSIAILAVFFLFLSGACLAQGGKGGGGWGPGTNYNRLYNPKTVENISGEIEKIEVFTPRKGMSQGMHLFLKTGTGSIPVHLGPSWYIESQNVKFEAGNKVQVTGSRVTFDKKPAIIASEIRKGDQVLKLRDPNGAPVWSRRGSK